MCETHAVSKGGIGPDERVFCETRRTTQLAMFVPPICRRRR